MVDVSETYLARWRSAVEDAVRPMHNTPPGFADDPEIGYVNDYPVTLSAIVNAVYEAKSARSGIGIKLPEDHGMAVIPDDFVKFLQFRAGEMAAQGGLKFGPRLKIFEAAMDVRDRNDRRLEELHPGALAEVTLKREARRPIIAETVIGLGR